MADIEMLQTIYDNTVLAAYKTAAPLAAEDVCFELATLLGVRTDEDAVPTESISCVLEVIDRLNTDYTNLYISRKEKTDLDVRYWVGFSDSRKSFAIRIVQDKKYEEHLMGLVMFDILKEVLT